MYTSFTLSLAALEFFVHLDPDLVPDDFVAVPADVPPELKIEHLEIAGLPPNWRAYPAPEALQDLGTAWVSRSATPLLSVPTAALPVPPEVIPEERNFLLNPAHAEFDRIRTGDAHAFHFDVRMRKAQLR